MALLGWAYDYQCRAGSYFAIPEIVGFIGIYVAYQGVANVWRIVRNTKPKSMLLRKRIAVLDALRVVNRLHRKPGLARNADGHNRNDKT